jgi:Amt family ammonium transporter
LLASSKFAGPVVQIAVAALGVVFIAYALACAMRIDRTTRSAVSELQEFLNGPDGVPAQGSNVDALRSTVRAVTAKLEAIRHRLTLVHASTGLPTREVLLSAIEASRAEPRSTGLLGVIELVDFDQLCAFDSVAADFAVITLAQRLERMVAPSHVVSQIDQARFAIWFGQSPIEASRGEFDALCYALRDRVVGPNVDIVPQLAVACAISDAGSVSASATLATAIGGLSPVDSSAALPSSTAGGQARERFELEQDLRCAIDRHQLEMWYQPLIDAAVPRVCGAEALIRWRHPDHGLVSPARFMPMAESMGIAPEIGLWVFNTTCSQASQWPEQGLVDIRVAVNLSAHQLTRSDLDLVVERLIQRHGLPGPLLELELTETVATLDPARANKLFAKLRSLGIGIAIDDFGSGYSSLSSLKALRFDKIKIDREFVTRVDTDSECQAICQAIIALGRGLAISVLAEGIERREEYEWLRRHGCRYFQGYYFSKPLELQPFIQFAGDTEHVRALADVGPASLHDTLTKILA